MRYGTPMLLAAVVGLGLATSTGAADKVRVVASLPELKSLVEAVGGDLVEVDALARGSQNAHDVELRPSLMVKLRRADLFITNGLELDYWADPLAHGANNPRVILGSPGRVDASRGIRPLEVPTGRVDRSMGDVHPLGNPHYTLDPENAATITANIVEGLAGVAPQHRTTFESRRQQFLGRLTAAQARWAKSLEPFKGTRVVVNHNTWIYFLTRFGLEQAGTIEDRPGIPASPAHLARLIRLMQQERVKVVILEAWGDRRQAERIASEAGAKVVVLAHSVGAVKGTDSYLDMFEYNVTTLASALR